MVEIRPFRGTRYNAQLIGNLNLVLTPPYDVISEEQRKGYLRRHRYNAVNLILGDEHAGDDEYNNKYLRAKMYLESWKRDGVLVDDRLPSFYFYRLSFKDPEGKTKQRRGIYTLVKLKEYEEGVIRRHEQTHPRPKEDRLRLLRATEANFCSIFALFDDPENQVEQILAQAMELKPWVQVEDDEAHLHELWVVSQRAIIEQLVQLMRTKKLFIADGHHRYETGLLFREEMREASGLRDGHQPFDYSLMCLSTCNEDNVVLLPTHRVLARELGSGIEMSEVMEELAQNFELQPCQVNLTTPEKSLQVIQQFLFQQQHNPASFAMVLEDGSGFLITLKKGVKPGELVEEKLPEELKKLNTTILHQYIIKVAWLGNPQLEPDDLDIFYTADAKDALQLLKKRKGCVAFLLNPIKLEQIKRIVSEGLLMPPKSTYFFPKVITGLVMRDMRRG